MSSLHFSYFSLLCGRLVAEGIGDWDGVLEIGMEGLVAEGIGDWDGVLEIGMEGLVAEGIGDWDGVLEIGMEGLVAEGIRGWDGVLEIGMEGLVAEGIGGWVGGVGGRGYWRLGTRVQEIDGTRSRDCDRSIDRWISTFTEIGSCWVSVDQIVLARGSRALDQ